MTHAAICDFLRHPTHQRHIGDLIAIWCDVCGLIPPDPEPEPVAAVAIDPAPDPIPAAFVDGWAPGELMEAWGR